MTRLRYLSAYSDEEVVSILEQVQGELVNRRIEKTAVLEPGKYVGGQDIPAGNYVLVKEADVGESDIVWLRAADDPEDDYPSKLYEFVKQEDAVSFYISVAEGDTLKLPFRASLTISVGAKFE